LLLTPLRRGHAEAFLKRGAEVALVFITADVGYFLNFYFTYGQELTCLFETHFFYIFFRRNIESGFEGAENCTAVNFKMLCQVIYA
jgi:hypothetical protein